jgi:excisionase family DNA binding protein
VKTVQGNITGRKSTASSVLASPVLSAAGGPPYVVKARRVPDACRVLGISKAMLYKLAAQGKVRLVHIGGRTIVPETEIDRLASEGAA